MKLCLRRQKRSQIKIRSCPRHTCDFFLERFKQFETATSMKDDPDYELMELDTHSAIPTEVL